MHKSSYLKHISLHNYRNFTKINLEISTDAVIVILGDNGTGKTNILEAISQLAPGKGLRSAKLEDICNNNGSKSVQRANEWSINTLLMQSSTHQIELTLQYNALLAKKIALFNGSKISNQELIKIINVVWLIPQMEGIFLDNSSNRRKFFDRIVYNFDQEHAKNLNKYTYYTQERIKMLTDHFMELRWLEVLELKIAEISEIISKSRHLVIHQIQNNSNIISTEFPKALIQIEGIIEQEFMKNASREHIVQFIQKHLFKNRDIDRINGRSTFGIHKSDFIVYNHKNQIRAKHCSTGEQKALLISIMLAQIYTMINQYGIKPILLLDELFVHLDDKRKGFLSNFIKEFQLQTFITTTDFHGIENVRQNAQIIHI